jgi:3-oxoacyl-[acyl-carrier protein] reductase
LEIFKIHYLKTISMDLNLKGKNTFVGGSSRGIGKATAIELAKLGANVTLVSRSPEIMIDIIHELDKLLGE